MRWAVIVAICFHCGVALTAAAAETESVSPTQGPEGAAQEAIDVGDGGHSSTPDSSWSTALTSILRDERASGLIRMDYFRAPKTLDNPGKNFFGATAQLKFLPTLGGGWSAKVEGRATNPDVSGGATTGQLLEGYATYRFEKGDLRIGKQIVAWGRADGLNPTDNLTPRDYQVALPFDEDTRFGTWALRFDMFLSSKDTLTAFTTPFFEPSRVPLPAAGYTYIDQRPARSLSNSELGIKFDESAEGLDWSVSYYRGFYLFPQETLLEHTPAGTTVALNYDRITAYGADFARNYGRFGFRGEIAYIDTPHHGRSSTDTMSPFLYWIAGVDRTFFDNLNVNLQVFEHRVDHFRERGDVNDPFAQLLALENAILAGQQDARAAGISFRVSDKWLNDTLQGEVFAAINFKRANSFLRPLLTYAFSDHWKGTLGGDFYRGGLDTQYGSLKPTGGVFVEVRYGY